ncbi:MAG: undecaprenyl/decaprenyl-phosphate alpha-N-acetylglucosaminyl 1-phosphate transferase [Candidatus Jacksonbacteria bacterium]|nr:undecaprenyl/decaprenyl-phosphate alpha-N-acetylglucosaminyl 1-phosphate transferase [Candidatus Jacksonbacteria bacterium]
MKLLFFIGITFFLPFAIAAFATPIIRAIALNRGVNDPTNITPLLGGIAIFFSFIISVFALGASDVIDFSLCSKSGEITSCSGFEALILVLGLILGMIFLLIGGVLDDIYRLSPSKQIIWPMLAAMTAVMAGIGQDNITNPLYFLGLSHDPLIHLNVRTIPIFGFDITVFTDLFTFVWLMVLMYATKLLDGLNGLVPGITVIGGGILFLISMGLGQPLPAMLALILTGAYLGFLPHNLAGKIFLGESGSTIAGFLLGVLSLMGPAKISITLLVLGLPIFDLLWVMYERRFRAKISPFIGDARHMHFKLVRSGLSPRRAVILLWGVSLIFGVLGLVLQGIAHGALLAGLVALMGGLLFMTNRKTAGV